MVLQPPETCGSVEHCPVCDGEPRVLVVMRHPAMLRFTRELLERECGCWVATEARSGPSLARALDDLTPDLLVIDAADFPSCCLAAVDHVPLDRVIVIGPEPDHAYRDVAFANGAGGWLARDEVADKLGSVMRRVLGCRHDPCPPGHHRSSPSGHGSPTRRRTTAGGSATVRQQDIRDERNGLSWSRTPSAT